MVVSDEQISKNMTIFCINYEQMSNWLGVVRTNQIGNPFFQLVGIALDGVDSYHRGGQLFNVKEAVFVWGRIE